MRLRAETGALAIHPSWGHRAGGPQASVEAVNPRRWTMLVPLLLLAGCSRGADALAEGSVTVSRQLDGLLHLSTSMPLTCDRISESLQATAAGKPMRRVKKTESKLVGKTHCAVAFELDDKVAPLRGKTLFELGDGSRTARVEVSLFAQDDGFELVEPKTLDGIGADAVLRFRLKPSGRLHEPSCSANVGLGDGRAVTYDCKVVPAGIELRPQKLADLPKTPKQLILSGIVDVVGRCEGIGACIGSAPITMGIPIRYE